MNMKKIICLGMSVAMAAALAVPACAADTDTQDTKPTNTTEVVLNYLDEFNPQDEGAFTIKIPAQVDLKATDNGEDGVTLEGIGTVELDGNIGQNDYVNIDITSGNNYQLVDKATGESVALYEMWVTSDEDNGIEVLNFSKSMDGYFHCSTLNSKYLFNRDLPMFLVTESRSEFANAFAKGFQSGSTITMTFEDNGPNEIFGKGEYTDTLTFDYQYMTTDSTSDTGYTASDISIINIDNSVVAAVDTDPQDDFDGPNSPSPVPEYDT